MPQKSHPCLEHELLFACAHELAVAECICLHLIPDVSAYRAFAKHVGTYHEGELSADTSGMRRSEEHTSELQSPDHLVCRLLLEKKKKNLIHSHAHST